MAAAAALPQALSAVWRPLLTGIVLIGLIEAAKRGHLLPVFVPAPSEVVMRSGMCPGW